MTWKIEYIKEAQRDLLKLDPYNRRIILKAIEKTAERPLPPPDGPDTTRSSCAISGTAWFMGLCGKRKS